MRLFAIALTLVLTVRGASATPEPRVVGGQPVYPGQFPFLVGLVYSPSNGVGCTGSLIRNTWVLTAAHCITETQTPPTAVMISDALQGADGPTHQVANLQIKRIIVHPQWSPTTNENDIALIELMGDATQFPPLGIQFPQLLSRLPHRLPSRGLVVSRSPDSGKPMQPLAHLLRTGLTRSRPSRPPPAAPSSLHLLSTPRLNSATAPTPTCAMVTPVGQSSGVAAAPSASMGLCRSEV